MIKQWNNTLNQENDKRFFSLGFVEMTPLPQLDFPRGVFLAHYLASTDNLTGTINRQNTYQRKECTKCGSNKQHKNCTMTKTDTACFSCQKQFATSCQETQRVYSYNLRACAGLSSRKLLVNRK